MLKDMKSYGHLKPGQKGTHRLVAQFGAALVCVRYRYDEQTGDNLTTAEIIVDRRPGNRKLRYTTDNPSYYYLRYKILNESGGGSVQETFYTLNLSNAKREYKGVRPTQLTN